MPATKTTRKAGAALKKDGSTAKKTAAGSKTARKVTLDDVWATIDEIGKAHRETEKAIKETQAAHRETEKAIKETQAAQQETKKNIDRMSERVDLTTANVNKMSERVDRIAKNVGGLNQSIGELIEILVVARLWEKCPEYSLQRAYRRLPLYDEKNEPKAEIDILLVNTEWAMAVEVKRHAELDDVKRNVERMRRILQYPPEQLQLRPTIKLLGAIAGGVVTPECRAAAHEAGFFVLELAGESVNRVTEPSGFKPKVW
jgi:chromosome segregation ATPase